MYKLEYDTRQAKKMWEELDKYVDSSLTPEEAKEKEALSGPKADLEYRGYTDFALSEPNADGIIIVTVHSETVHAPFPLPEHFWPCRHLATNQV